MAQDITLMGASYPAVPAVTLPKTGGGTASFWDMDTDISYLGVNAEHLGKIYEKSYKLNETTYPNWTPSTTASAIVASTTLTDKIAADMSQYEYILRWRFKFVRTGTSGATLKAVPNIEVDDLYQIILKRANSLANIQADNPVGNTCVTMFTGALLDYYNSSGSHTYTFATSYGFYLAATAATFSNSTADSMNITVKTPAINARCSTTYFATSRASQIDQTVTSLWLRGDAYRIRKNALVRSVTDTVVDIYNNGI